MKIKEKLIMAITTHFLVSTIVCTTSVNTIKTGEAVKVQSKAEGSKVWDQKSFMPLLYNLLLTII